MNCLKPSTLCSYLWMLLLTLLMACDQRPAANFKLTDVTGADFGQHYELLTPEGSRVNERSFQGRVVLIFFGYTQCPDVCPTTLGRLAAVIKSLEPAQQQRVQGLFVTLDPARDKPELLKVYAPSFDAHLIGTSAGDEVATQKLAQAFKIFYQKVPGSQPGHYTLDHSSAVYIYDPEGRLRLFFSPDKSQADLKHDLELLLQGA